MMLPLGSSAMLLSFAEQHCGSDTHVCSCRYTLMQMEGHSLAVGHMQRLSKTRGCLQTLRDTGQEIERVLANANANLGPKEASFPIFVPPRVASAEYQCTICTDHAGCGPVHVLPIFPAILVVCYHINVTLISFHPWTALLKHVGHDFVLQSCKSIFVNVMCASVSLFDQELTEMQKATLHCLRLLCCRLLCLLPNWQDFVIAPV